MNRPGGAEAVTRASRSGSLRNRGLLLAVLVLAISLGIVGAALDRAFTQSSEADLSRQMETWTYLVLGATELDSNGSLLVQGGLDDPRLSQPGSGIYVVVQGDGESWASPSSLGIELPTLQAIEPGQDRFVAAPSWQELYLRQYGVAWELDDETVKPFTVSVLVEGDIVGKQIRSFRRGLWKSLGAAGLLLAIAQLLFFTLSMRPLKRIAGDVASVETGEQDQLAGKYPRELQPLTSNLNRLLATEKANQARYRNALDSLAHSLKTPLAVIRAGLGRESERDAMENAVGEMQHLIASRLERAAASARRTMAAPVAVEPQARRIIASLQKVYSQVLKKVDVNIDPELVFYGEERDLLEMMGNLLDNACKYGEGHIGISAGTVESERTRPGLWLVVENSGKAVDPAHYDRLLQRGVRGDERVEGHGLGLTIVLELVNAYGGDISLGQSDLGGARFKLTIPPA